MDKETYTDPNGFIITKCCASCIHQEADSEFFRVCKKGHGRLRPDDSCGKDYEPKEISKKGAVMGAGRIKRNSYLVYLREHFGEVFDKVMLEKKKEALDLGKDTDHITVTTIEVIDRCREEYTEVMGLSIYQDI